MVQKLIDIKKDLEKGKKRRVYDIKWGESFSFPIPDGQVSYIR